MAKKRGRRRSQSVQAMIDSFMTYRKDGHYSIAQIANKSGVSTSTIYSCLDEIAEKYGVPREALLDRASSPHSTHSTNTYNEDLNKRIEGLFNQVRTSISSLMNSLDEKMEECNE